MQLSHSRIVANLRNLKPLISEVCRTAGVPGLAVGVICDGRILHEDYFGYRDVQAKLLPDRDTIFFVASLTKAMTAASVGILVDQGALEWTTPVHQILPEMSKSTMLYAAGLTVIDLLSHRSRVTWADALYLQSNNNILLPKEQSITTFDSLKVVAPPRSRYMYNNHAYNIVGLIIERLSGKTWGQFVKEKLFDPLNMTRTFTTQPEDSNVALPYNILKDKTPFLIPQCNVSDKTMMFAGQSVRTSMGDLLCFYQSYLQAMQQVVPFADNANTYTSEKPLTSMFSVFSWIKNTFFASKYEDSKGEQPIKSPMKEIAEIVRPQISRPVNSIFEQTYALGWNRTQLPGKLDYGWNSGVVSPFPLLGKQYPGRLSMWHGGNMPGTTAAVCLIPESRTGVVVLQNSLGLCDAADWVSQLILDTIYAGKPAHDYVALASEGVANCEKRMKDVQERLDKERTPGTSHRALNEYTGLYYNSVGNWVIEVCLDETSTLCLKFQGRNDETYMLRHYHHDMFVWNLSYDETVKRAQYCRPYPYYRMEFESSMRMTGDEKESIDSLRWHHDPYVPEGEVFRRLE